MFHSFQTCTSDPDLSETEDEEKVDPTTVGYYINRKSTYAGLQTYCNYEQPSVDHHPKGKVKVHHNSNKVVPIK